jgi:dTDP-4-dehydrorhamnose 3,5-epimerase
VTFRFKNLGIPEVILIEPDTYPDDRGFFRETFRRSGFAEGGIDRDFVQANFSRSRKNVLRGLHYQREPAAVGKLVTVAQGGVFDVAADVRPGSPSFGRWVGEELSAENGRMLFVPEGFAHGFCALEDDTLVTYLMTGEFSPEHDTGVRWNDPEIGVEWPIDEPILSSKDQALPSLNEIRASAAKEATR